ncbi:hypothetical protein [Pedobacter sp. UBA5917]|jgi:hypothetical protein|uniref:hypothetical protein n=1 Tax=Pedobacter sp. UBA5917 TaxID=1947061 RepID=UPI0025F3E83E|nr:hypothetical protein [Pedobacter sp. UBA5917]
MNLEFDSLVKKLYSGTIVKEEFVKLYFNGKIPSEHDILDLIAYAISIKDSRLIEEVVVLLYTGYFKTESFLLVLCGLLSAHWHIKHEDIVTLLKEIKSPKAVNCLYSAVELRFAYLDYDDTYQFARKCIKALSVIGDENAVEKLKLLTNSKIPIIGEYAERELRNKGVL